MLDTYILSAKYTYGLTVRNATEENMKHSYMQDWHISSGRQKEKS